MLFNSYEFIFIFLPPVLVGYFALGSRNQTAATLFLVVASLVFYSRAAPMSILISSVLINWMIYLAIRASALRRVFLVAGISANLTFLAYFKYIDFLIGNLNALTGLSLPAAAVELPPGISFFTFTQIMFLVDAYCSRVDEAKFARYALFVSYFPHLIAGPLLHHRDIMPQFARASTYRPDLDRLAAGLTVFVFGLFKKVVIADGLAQHAEPVFKAADGGAALDFADAWCGVLAFAFQIYFDFSAYSDMAIGLGYMFGVRMPINFYSPYRATNIIAFWRLWHMTLSHFLRDYVYIPLGGNRHGTRRRYANLMATMLLGGLWHGASWNFVIWGGLHGLYLVANRLLQKRFASPNSAVARPDVRASRPLAFVTSATRWGLTFVAVTVAWPFFRAETFQGAQILLGGMAGIYGHGIPLHASTAALSLVVGALFFCLVLPNCSEIMILHRPALGIPVGAGFRRQRRFWARCGLIWRPNLCWAMITAAVAAASFYVMFSRTTTVQFLYYQF